MKTLKELEKGFECVFCKTFLATFPSARRHALNVHLTPKAISCQVCAKIFKTQSGLASHVFKYHGERIIQCPVNSCHHQATTIKR